MRNGLLQTLLFLSIFSAAAAAETVYVHDQLRLGVRAAPDSAEKSIAVVKTGDALSVLGEQDHFIKIRTESGLEGWVSKGYVSTEPPAQNRLKAAQQELESLKTENQSLQQKLNESVQQAEKQRGEVAVLQRDNAVLKQRLGELSGGDEGIYQRLAPLLGLAALLISFLAGLILGARRKARQVAERIGGLEI